MCMTSWRRGCHDAPGHWSRGVRGEAYREAYEIFGFFFQQKYVAGSAGKNVIAKTTKL